MSSLFKSHFQVCLTYRLNIVLLITLLMMSAHAWALSDKLLFQHAREAYAEKNELALAEDVAQLKSQEYLLAPYADYWLMLLRLNQADNTEVQNFIQQYANMAFTDRLRGEWLKKLGKQQEWGLFFEQYGQFRRTDTAVECFALFGKNQLDHIDISVQGRAIWLTSADLPSSCNQLFDAMQKDGTLTADDLWARLRLALHDGQLNVAKSIATRIAEFDKISLKLLDTAYRSPKSLFTPASKKSSVTSSASFKTRDGIEVNLYALDRLARTDLETAMRVYEKIQPQFSDMDRKFASGRIAYHAARQHHPQALTFYADTGDIALDKEQLAWMVRSALRVQNWDVVLNAINRMPPEQLEEGAWRYWKARALKAQGVPVEANIILGQLSRERHYYGWLAAEELGSVISNEQQQYTPNELEVSAIASQPGVKRALELQRLDMRWEAKAEWLWAIQGYDDKQLLAASEYARRQQWYDVAISTADNTRQLHDFGLRYPTPYRDLFRAAAHNEGLEEAWIYGLTRQESRFMHYAKSGVGASGLMQLMPTTAKWAAKRMGLSSYSRDMIHDIKFNVGIGAYYMRYTLEMMQGQAVMATAAYNAGPSRAKRWVADEPLEAAIYIETIPFNETRLYVQKVMANAQMYAPRLGQAGKTLKERMGVVPGRNKPSVMMVDNESE